MTFSRSITKDDGAPADSHKPGGGLSFSDKRTEGVRLRYRQSEPWLSVRHVVAKRRGSGLLAWPHTLDAFLDEIFSSCDCRISIKTRLGTTDTDEWETLLAIYDKYPLEELIIHPRIQKDFYKYTPRMECYRTAYETSRHSLCYNGDLFSTAGFSEALP